ncbi:heat shock factor 2-binding protein isoform X2 [Cephus cinctus]|uniref:Heat shock factor 2-binding protein isoform X2 n=1 Tax=Cephus cinctus TaxID=211228 RepID=A0AAJ7VWB6_CEPCN|nr:heat shock factor 2-binding protein isoform X2 [Cephus cinctus]
MDDAERSDELFEKSEEEFLDKLNLDRCLQSVEVATRKLHTNVHLLVDPVMSTKTKETIKMTELQSRYDDLYSKWQSQQRQLESTQAEIFRLKNQIMHQSTFCTSLGAVLCNLLWRASYFTQNVHVWLSGFQNKVGEFLCIVNGSFVSFINTYGDGLPSMNSDEFQFIMGLLGIVTNMSSTPEGREFLITNTNGKDLVQKLVIRISGIPLPSGNSLKRLMLMILYNVSVNQTGLQYLLELRVGEILGKCFEDSVPMELQVRALWFLQSITYDLNDATALKDILKAVPMIKIEKMTENEQDPMAPIAKEILENLEKAKATLNFDVRNSTNIN